MINKDDEIKFHNVLFPVWMLSMFPPAWLIVVPGNFIIDSFVFIISLALLKISDKKQFYKKHILKIFLFGMLADIVGAVFMLVMTALEFARMGDEPYMTVPALIISAGLIFVFNYFFTFKKLDKILRMKLSVIFAVVTAPYTFLIPSAWLYSK